MATYEGTTFEEMNLPNILEVGDVIRLNYSGAMQKLKFNTFKNFKQIKLLIECWGAYAHGGKGGFSKGEKTFYNNDVIYCYCGGIGRQNEGGFNGGGDAVRTSSNSRAYGGGGATDIRLNVDDLYNRFIVAGGGSKGSAYEGNTPENSHGGGLVGMGYGDTGGTQSRGGIGFDRECDGSFGKGGNAKSGSGGHSAGGGGGYWGGCGSVEDSNFNSNKSINGGGSGYIGGVKNGETHNGSTSYGNPGSGYLKLTVLEIINPLNLNFTGIAKRDNSPNYGD